MPSSRVLRRATKKKQQQMIDETRYESRLFVNHLLFLFIQTLLHMHKMSTFFPIMVDIR